MQSKYKATTHNAISTLAPLLIAENRLLAINPAHHPNKVSDFSGRLWGGDCGGGVSGLSVHSLVIHAISTTPGTVQSAEQKNSNRDQEVSDAAAVLYLTAQADRRGALGGV